ncbi:hypothetical protein EDC51_1117 [Bibersteinia trehalosi]|uniref:hypothetical protein n=1 Tax=Bibersteinia trehalosi TaxID=47735 RepID=UPI00104AE301|nr:hypothetical protein [Bibersteinia trehalosi]TCT13721.1 hypothetical protein EDC51_1117 [Bibersteinia trehalosi]
MQNHIEQAKNKSFTEKVNFVLALLDDGEIDEPEAYKILTAEGEPKPPEKPESQQGTIDFF